MQIELRAQVRFEEEVLFDGFLPLAPGDVAVELGVTGFVVRIVVDSKEHVARTVTAPGIDFERLDRHRGIRCNGFQISLTTDVDPELFHTLQGAATNSATREFGARVLSAIETVHDSFVEFARNEYDQFWLAPRTVDQVSPGLVFEADLQQQLMRYDTRFRIAAGWQMLDAAPNTGSRMEIRMFPGIDRRAWGHLHDCLTEGGYCARPHRRLLSNAFAHLWRQDLRAAIVESIAAWEMVLSHDVPALLASRQSARTADDWRREFERVGMRESSKQFVDLASQLPAVVEFGAQLLEAIELRNTVIHKGQRKIDRVRVEKLLRAVQRVVHACEGADLRSPA